MTEPTIISRKYINNALRELCHRMTMDNLKPVLDGTQKTIAADRLYCRCDACSLLTERIQNKIRKSRAPKR